MSRPPLQCGSCVQCCYNRPRYTLEVGQVEVAMFDYDIERGPGGKLYLKQDERGDCVYATPAGCAIHAIKPVRCATWDCRVHEHDHPSFRIRLCARLARERSER